MPWLVLGTILSILAATILLTTLHLRDAMRQKIIEQDGYVLFASSFVQPSLLEELGPDIAADPELSFAVLADQMFETALASGSLALTLFDAEGQLQMARPFPATPRHLSARETAAMAELRPISSFEPFADMSDYGFELRHAPIVRALIPLPSQGVLVGSAEFILDGHNVAKALQVLNEDLLRYSLLSFLVGGAIITVSLGWSYRRLIKMNQLLAERSQSLLRANHELALAAKTSAIGAITAHLIHDLKSPLFGLQSFVSARGIVDDQDWDHAADAAQRMQKLIGEIVRILQEERTTENYSITGEELLDLLESKLKGQAESAGVDLAISGTLSESLLNRDANITLLILTNLGQNAIHAAPRGGQVSVTARRTEWGGSFEISDTGPGLPAHVIQNLFTPTRSTKAGGTGLGLAISRQLAIHLGAELCLKQTSCEGTTFELRVPEKVLSAELARS